MLTNIIALAVILLVVGSAAFYIIRAKKKGNKCIGCPYGRTCERAKNGGCSAEKTQ